MTNYNERLDELITSCDFEPEAPHSRICKWCGEAKGTSIHTTRQALTSLIKELVADAKPEKRTPDYYSDSIDLYSRQCAANSWNKAIDQFEQNLLKALEERE